MGPDLEVAPEGPRLLDILGEARIRVKAGMDAARKAAAVMLSAAAPLLFVLFLVRLDWRTGSVMSSGAIKAAGQGITVERPSRMGD